MADVTLTYKGNTILELNDSAEKSIKTAGKYLEDDIGLNYVKSGGGYTSIGDGNNFIKNYDFSLNNTGVTQWSNSGPTQDEAIDFWVITQASLSCNQDGSVRLSRNGNANAYLMQLFLPDQLSQFVGKNCKIIAIINGITYASEGILSNSGTSVDSYTPYGTIRMYKYSNYYAVTVDIQNSAADYIDISKVAFGLASNLVFPPSLITKTIAQNGTYNASADNANGYSSVTINVPSSSWYPPLPNEYQELEYLTTNADNGHPYITVNAPQVRDVIQANFLGDGVILGSRVNSWNFNVATSVNNCTPYYCATLYASWNIITQEVNTWSSFAIIPNYVVAFNYGRWDASDFYNGNLGIMLIKRIVSIGDTYDTIWYGNVAALIPCYRKVDGVNGFYDTINEIFYTSPTGTFTRGPEKQ